MGVSVREPPLFSKYVGRVSIPAKGVAFTNRPYIFVTKSQGPFLENRYGVVIYWILSEFKLFDTFDVNKGDQLSPRRSR